MPSGLSSIVAGLNTWPTLKPRFLGGSPFEVARLAVSQVLFRPQAEGEALEVRRWYESRSPGLGEQFTQSMEGLIVRISETPFAFPAVHGETRRAVFRRFPFAI
jgi:hypothetical protein